MHKPTLGIFILTLTTLGSVAHGQNVSDYANIPEPLLFLLREPAVQEDLSLTSAQQRQLVELNDRFDGQLLASRNVAPEESQKKVGEALTATREGIDRLLDDKQRTRLKQIAYRTRGIACVLIPDVAAELELTDTQQEAIQTVVERTASSITQLQRQLQAQSVSREQANQQLSDLRRDEQLEVLRQLDSRQQQQLRSLVGAGFDLSKLGHVSFKAPALSDTGIWINSPPLSPTDLEGKVVALHFWAFGCINCIHNYEWYKGWQQEYADDGLLIIGVHTPETSRERDVEAVRDKVREAGFAFPVVVDNDRKIWDAWGNSMWPSVYLIDKQGRLRYWWYGELNWQGAGGQKMMAERIEQLLAE